MGQYKMWEAIEKVITVFAPIITSITTIIAVRMQIINDRKMQNRPEIVLKKYEEINKDKSKVLNKNESNDLCHSDEEELFAPSFETERIKDIVDLTKINKSNYRIELINVPLLLFLNPASFIQSQFTAGFSYHKARALFRSGKLRPLRHLLQTGLCCMLHASV